MVHLEMLPSWMHKLTLLMPWQTELYVVSYVNMQVKEFCRLEKLPRLETYLFHGRLNEQLRKCRVEMYTRSLSFSFQICLHSFKIRQKHLLWCFRKRRRKMKRKKRRMMTSWKRMSCNSVPCSWIFVFWSCSSSSWLCLILMSPSFVS